MEASAAIFTIDERVEEQHTLYYKMIIILPDEYKLTLCVNKNLCILCQANWMVMLNYLNFSIKL